MILVNKMAAPKKLSDGEQLVQSDCAAFEENPALYKSGKQKFTFDRNVYGDRTVKDKLREAQHKKCCFCEGTFEANAAADVEHYRPKSFSQQGCGTPKIYPGYYWLAYDWENLFFCCQTCNRYHKKNFFPLRNPNARVRDHLGDLESEEPLILNPGGPDDPRDHLHFRDEIAVGDTDFGNTTIEVVDLNRLPLVEERLETLKPLRLLHEFVTKPNDHGSEKLEKLVEKTWRELKRAVQPEAKFSAMVTDFLPGGFSEDGAN